MSLPNYLAKIKSAGIYRFIWDKSEVPAGRAETLRLVVGYSEKGPFNTPVYIDKSTDFIKIFGDISKKWEKRGVFFHRMALQALRGGPILALNLKKFSTEKVSYKAFDPNWSPANTSTDMILDTTSIKNVFDTTRFWSLDPDLLPKQVQTDSQIGGKRYVTLVSTDSKETSCTVIVRGFAPTGYDISFKTWYTTSGEEMPSYLEGYENMLVSDFFAEVYVFRGKFTPELATTEELKRYFTVVDNQVMLNPSLKNAFGDKIDTLDTLAADENSGFIQKYQGVMLPYFKDLNGSYLSLDLLFNSDNDIHKMLMKFDDSLLDDEEITVMDITSRGWDGWTENDLSKFCDGEEKVLAHDFCSNMNINPTVTKASYDDSDDVWNYTDVDSNGYLHDSSFVVYDAADAIDLNNLPVKYIDLGWQEGDRFLVKVNDTLKVSNLAKYEVLYNGDDPIGLDVQFADADAELPTINTTKYVTVTGEKSVVGSTLRYTFQVDSVDVVEIKIKADAEMVDTTQEIAFTVTAEGGEAGTATATWNAEEGAFIGTYNLTEAQKNKNLTVDAEVDVEGTTSFEESESVIITGKIVSTPVFVKCNHIATDNVFDINVSGSYLEGYVMNSEMVRPKSTDQYDKLMWQTAILNVLKEEPGLFEALTNNTDVEYRLLVDTFESFVDTELKSVLTYLTRKKDNALALINFPAIKTFVDCKYTSFTDTEGFKMKYVVDGGNKRKPIGRLFSLPLESNGASWAAYYTPIMVTDGTVKTVVPSAALVSNLFMEKYNMRHAYDVVAGPNYGRIVETGLVGPDYNYSRSDLDLLEPFGVNAMVYVPRRGTLINSNQTAKQTPKTALSSVNVRELVIYLQDEIAYMLQSYQWELNTQTLRDNVKAKADTILDNVQGNGGVYAFRNTCDESNNTDEVIDNEMLVLSTEIEPTRGAGKMVEELTIYRKGGMTSSAT